MAQAGRTWGIFAAGLALGLGAAWFLLSDRGNTPAPRAAPKASRPAAAVAAPAAPVAAVKADCGDDLLLAKSDARDGDVALLETRSTTAAEEQARDFIVQGKEAAAGGRRRDAEANFINACRVAEKLPASASELLADAMYRLGRLYAQAAPDAPRRQQLTQRATELHTAALQTYRAKLGDGAEKTRFAAAGLAALGGAQTAQGAQTVQGGQLAQAQQGTAKPAPRTEAPTRPAVVAKAAPPAKPVRPEAAAEPATPEPAAPQRMARARPSFDCALARSRAEKLICGDEDLARADRELGAIYARAKAAAPDRRAFQRDSDEQWRWREQNCRDRECLRQWYADRREQLLASR